MADASGLLSLVSGLFGSVGPAVGAGLDVAGSFLNAADRKTAGLAGLAVTQGPLDWLQNYDKQAATAYRTIEDTLNRRYGDIRGRYADLAQTNFGGQYGAGAQQLMQQLQGAQGIAGQRLDSGQQLLMSGLGQNIGLVNQGVRGLQQNAQGSQGRLQDALAMARGGMTDARNAATSAVQTAYSGAAERLGNLDATLTTASGRLQSAMSQIAGLKDETASAGAARLAQLKAQLGDAAREFKDYAGAQTESQASTIHSDAEQRLAEIEGANLSPEQKALMRSNVRRQAAQDSATAARNTTAQYGQAAAQLKTTHAGMTAEADRAAVMDTINTGLAAGRLTADGATQLAQMAGLREGAAAGAFRDIISAWQGNAATMSQTAQLALEAGQIDHQTAIEWSQLEHQAVMDLGDRYAQLATQGASYLSNQAAQQFSMATTVANFDSDLLSKKLAASMADHDIAERITGTMAALDATVASSQISAQQMVDSLLTREPLMNYDRLMSFTNLFAGMPGPYPVGIASSAAQAGAANMQQSLGQWMSYQASRGGGESSGGSWGSLAGLGIGSVIGYSGGGWQGAGLGGLLGATAGGLI